MKIQEVDQIIKSFLSDSRGKEIAFRQLIKSIEYANSISSNVWSLSLFTNLFRLNVGRVEVLVVSSDFIKVNCIGKLGEWPFVGTSYYETKYRSIKEKQCEYSGNIENYLVIQDNILQNHYDFIRKAATKKNGIPIASSIYRRKNCQELLDYAYRTIESFEEKNSFFEIEAKYEEGNKVQVLDSRYERNQKARSLCLEYYGKKCIICGFSTDQLKNNGIRDIIHIHHLKPISEYDEIHGIDPVEDLRPVCPNCHSMIHSRKPIFSIEEIKEIINMKY